MIYGAVNPLGFSLPIWIATMCSEMLFGVAGALVGKALSPSEAAVSRSGVFSISLLLGIIGMLLTLVYDVATNVVWGYVYGPSMLTAVLIGFVPMGLVHMISNAFFFGTCGLPAASAITKVYGRKKIG